MRLRFRRSLCCILLNVCKSLQRRVQAGPLAIWPVSPSRSSGVSLRSLGRAGSLDQVRASPLGSSWGAPASRPSWGSPASFSGFPAPAGEKNPGEARLPPLSVPPHFRGSEGQRRLGEGHVGCLGALPATFQKRFALRPRVRYELFCCLRVGELQG